MTITSYLKAHRPEVAELVAQALPTVEHEAALELARRRKELVAVSFAEMDEARTWLDVRHARSDEAAFRRGYEHGFSQAMDNLRSACRPAAWQALAQWFDTVLTPWRYGRPVPMDPPPSYGTTRRAPPIVRAPV